MAPEAALPAAVPKWLLAFLAMLAWCIFSSSRMFVNKRLFRSGLPYPLAATGVCQLVSFFAAKLLSLWPAYRIQPCSSWQQHTSAALPAALATVSTLYAGNYGVMTLPVSFVQMVKGLTPSLTLVIAVLTGAERLTLPLAATVGLISGGSAISCLQQGVMPGFNLVGFLAQLAACASEAARAVCIKRMQAARPQGFHLAEALSMLALPSAVLLLGLSAIIEAPGVYEGIRLVLRECPELLALNAALSLLTDVMCDFSLRLTSSLTFKVAGIAKNVAVMVVGVMLGDTVTRVQALGYALSTAATIGYSTIRPKVAAKVKAQ